MAHHIPHGRNAFRGTAANPSPASASSVRQDARCALTNHREVSVNARVLSIAFSVDGRRLATASESGGVRVWELETGREAITLPNSRAGTVAVAFSPNGALIAAIGFDRAVSMWDAHTGRALPDLRWASPPTSDDLRYGNDQPLSIAFSRDSRFLASVGQKTNVRVWDIASGKSVVGPMLDFATVAFSSDGRLLAAGGDVVRLLDARTLVEVGPDVPARSVSRVAFSPVQSVLATAGIDGELHTWNLSTKIPVRGMRVDSIPLSSIAFAPDGNLVAAANWSGVIRMWSPRSGTVACSAAQEDQSYDVVFNPAGTLVASAGQSGKVHLWMVNRR